jgi:hypothetical protein
MARTAVGSAFVALTIAIAADAPAQDCQTRPLPIASDEQGEINGSDCSPPGYGRLEYWTIAVITGEGVRAIIRPVNGATVGVIVLNPAGNRIDAVADFQATYDGSAATSVTFLATASGPYRIGVVLSSQGPQVVPYGIFAERAIVPLPGQGRVVAVQAELRFEWSAVSATPILEYAVEVGSAPGWSDLGVFSMGVLTHVVASAPRGTYYLRFRARNAAGWGSHSGVYTFGSSGLPPGPTGLYATTRVWTDSDVSLGWTAPSSDPLLIRHYELIVGSRPGGSDLGIINVGAGGTAPGGQRSVYFPYAPPGTYYVRIRAMTFLGPSELSNEIVIVF